MAKLIINVRPDLALKMGSRTIARLATDEALDLAAPGARSVSPHSFRRRCCRQRYFLTDTARKWCALMNVAT